MKRRPASSYSRPSGGVPDSVTAFVDHSLAGIGESVVKYLTTLEAAHALDVSKQTLLNWLYAGKVPEPPRNPKGYRLWSDARVALVKRLIAQGRLHTRTVVHHRT